MLALVLTSVILYLLLKEPEPDIQIETSASDPNILSPYYKDPSLISRTVLINGLDAKMTRIEGSKLHVAISFSFFNGSGYPVELIGETKGLPIVSHPIMETMTIGKIPIKPIPYGSHGSFTARLVIPRELVKEAVDRNEQPSSKLVAKALGIADTCLFSVILEEVSVAFEAMLPSGKLRFFTRMPFSIDVSKPVDPLTGKDLLG